MLHVLLGLSGNMIIGTIGAVQSLMVQMMSQSFFSLPVNLFGLGKASKEDHRKNEYVIHIFYLF